MKYIFVVLFSALLIGLAPEKAPPATQNIHNSATKQTTQTVTTAANETTSRIRIDEKRNPLDTHTQEQPVTQPPKVAEPETPKAQARAEVQTQVPQGCDAYTSTFSQYDWNVRTAIAICKAESSGRTDALSPTCDRGLMQINCIHADMVNGNLETLFNPTTNIQVANRVYLSQGWRGWSTYNNGAYLKYL